MTGVPGHVGRPSGSPRGGGLVRILRQESVELPFLLPAFLLVGLTMIVPGFFALGMSFFDWIPGLDIEFIGVDNYVALLTSPRFHQILGNQLFLLLGLPLWTILPLLIAFALYEKVPAPGLFRTVMFFPAILSVTIVGTLFRAILVDDGLVNELLRAFGLGFLAADWLNDEFLVKPTLIVVLAWAGLGLGVVIYSAALSAMGSDQLEAALIDGANWSQRLRHVVVPSVRPTIILWTVFQVVGLFLFTFSWIYVLTFGGPAYASTTVDFDIYANAIGNGFFGLAAAESVLTLGIVIIITAVALLVLRRTPTVEPD